MGAGCTSGLNAFSQWSSYPTTKILITGRHGTGKTFLLYSWKYGVDAIMAVEPTKHFNVDTITSSTGKKFIAYDLAGNIGFRIRTFLDGVEGVICMLYHDEPLEEEEISTITKLLRERELDGIPFLFVTRHTSKSTEEATWKVPDWLENLLDGRPWEVISIRERCQEDADLVLKVLEKLLSQPQSVES